MYPDAGEKDWLTFEAWADVPEAIERAEVFAFGVAVENILRGRGDGYDTEGWNEGSGGTGMEDEEVPSGLVDLVRTCQREEPLQRPLFRETVDFFEREDLW